MASSSSIAPSSPASQPSGESHFDEPVPFDFVENYCQGNDVLKSYGVPTEPTHTGFLYVRAVKVTGTSAFQNVGLRFHSKNCHKDVSFTCQADWNGECLNLRKEIGMAFFDFQGTCPINVTLYTPESLLEDESDIATASFSLRDSSLVQHILHEHGAEEPLPEFLDRCDPELSDSHYLNKSLLNVTGNVFPTTILKFDTANITVILELASVVEGATRLRSGELLLQRAVRESRFVLVQLLLKLDAGRQLDLWTRFEILDVAMDINIAEVLVNRAEFFPKHRHCRQAIIAGNAELLHFYLFSGGGFAILLPEPALPNSSESETKSETLLTLACAMADVDCVQVLIDYAREERVVVDPFAPIQEPPNALAVWLQPDIESFSQIWTEAFDGCDSPVVAVVRGFPDGSRPRLPPGVNYKPDLRRVYNFGTSGTPSGTLEAQLEILEMLNDFGFCMNRRSGIDNIAPITAAVEIGNLELVQELLLYKANVYPSGMSNFTPLHQTCQMSHWHLLPTVLHAVKEQQESPPPALGRGSREDHECLNKTDAYGRTCLDIVVANVMQRSASIDPVLLGVDVNDKHWLKCVRAFISQQFAHHSNILTEVSRPLPLANHFCRSTYNSLIDFCTCAPRIPTALSLADILMLEQNLQKDDEAVENQNGTSSSSTKKNRLPRDMSFSLPKVDTDFSFTPEKQVLYMEIGESLRAIDLLLEAGAHTKVYSMSILVDNAEELEEIPQPQPASSSSGLFEEVSEYSFSDDDIVSI